MHNNHSPKELALDRKLDTLLNRIIEENCELTQLSLTLLDMLIRDEEIMWRWWRMLEEAGGWWRRQGTRSAAVRSKNGIWADRNPQGNVPRGEYQ